MTREKKIQQDKAIEAYIYLFIIQLGAFDYWLDGYLFYQVAYSLNCSVHKVKRVFFKNMLPSNIFRNWLNNFEY